MTDPRWTEPRLAPAHHTYTWRYLPVRLQEGAPDDTWTCDFCDQEHPTAPAGVLTNAIGVQSYVCRHCWAVVDRFAAFASASDDGGPLAFRLGPDLTEVPPGHRRQSEGA